MGGYYSTSATSTIPSGVILNCIRDELHKDDELLDTSWVKNGSVANDIDLRKHCPPVYDQGNLGSCTANAVGFAYEYSENCPADNHWVPSRLFIYYNERSKEGTTDKDAGASMKDAALTVRNTGVCPETEWPYDISKFEEKPTEFCYTDASTHCAKKVQKVAQNSDSLKAALAMNLPVIFGFTVYESFEKVKSDGDVPYPDTETEKELGGHAVSLVGCRTNDEGKTEWIVRNSWSEKWGDKGYCYFSEKHLLDADLCHGFWVVEV